MGQQTHQLKYPSTAVSLLKALNDTEGKVEAKIKQLQYYQKIKESS